MVGFLRPGHIYLLPSSLAPSLLPPILPPSSSLPFSLSSFVVGRLDTFDALIERNQIKLRKILESDKGDHVEAVLKVKHLYRSCMNTTAINDVGAAPLIGILDMIGEGVWVYRCV